MKRLLMHAVSVMMLAGCGSVVFAQQSKPEQAPASPNTVNPAPLTSGKPTTDPAASSAAVDPHKYVLGPEDVIFIRTWREPDFTFNSVIRPDGKITLPLYGELQAASLTPDQLTVNVKEALSKYLNNPDVTISVMDVRSKKYYIDGEVGRTGAFPLVSPITVLEALSGAGGFKEFANKKDVRILRKDKVLHFNWNEVTKGKKMEQNIYVENGDHIIVR